MQKNILLFLILLLILTLVRLAIFYYQTSQYKDGQRMNFSSTIISSPKTKAKFQSFSVQTPEGRIVYVSLNKPLGYSYGDNINLSGNLKIKLLNGKLSILTLSNPEIRLVKMRENNILAVVNSIRQKLIKSFRNNLPSDSSSLLLGIVFGIKQDMSQKFLSDFKSVGVMHVIAASGMNVTLVSGFMFYFFALIFKRQISILLTILGVIFYAALAGFEPSIIRASFMGIIAFSAQIFGRQQSSLYALIITGFLMLLLWPNFLFDIGFQLSFASTLGILFIPVLLKSLKGFLFEDFTTTISAQIATFPIILSNFGAYSPWSVVVNVLVLWTIPPLMILGGLAALTSFISEPLLKLFLALCLPLLFYFEEVVKHFSSLGAKISLDSIPWQLSLSYYFFLFSILGFLFRKRHYAKLK